MEFNVKRILKEPEQGDSLWRSRKSAPVRIWIARTTAIAKNAPAVICALFFIAAVLKHRDILTLIGSVVFSIAFVVFIIPLVESKRQKK